MSKVRSMLDRFSSERLTPRRFEFYLFLIAAANRLCAVVALRDIRKFHGLQAGADAVNFNQLALNLAHGYGFVLHPGQPYAFRAPGWPLLLAVVYKVFGEFYPAAYLLLCALGALSCVCVYLAARYLFSEDQARIAGLLSAFYIPHIYFATVFLSETLFAFLLSLLLLFLLRELDRPRLTELIGAALLTGYAILTRPAAVFLIPAVAAILAALHGWTVRQKLLRMAAFAAVSLAVVACWTARNYRVFHKFVLVTTNGGSTFYGSNNDLVMYNRDFLGTWVETPLLPHRDWVVAAPDEVEHDHREYQLGEAWVRQHLTAMPLLEAYKLFRLFAPDMLSGNKMYRLLQLAGYTPLLVLMIIGWVQCVRPAYRTAQWMMVHSLMLMTVISSLIFYGSSRFRDATLPALILYACAGLFAIASRFYAPPDRGVEPEIVTAPKARAATAMGE